MAGKTRAGMARNKGGTRPTHSDCNCNLPLAVALLLLWSSRVRAQSSFTPSRFASPLPAHNLPPLVVAGRSPFRRSFRLPISLFQPSP